MASVTLSNILTFLFVFLAVTEAQHHVKPRHAHFHKKKEAAPFPTGSPATGKPSNDSCYYWLENIDHQGVAPFAAGSSSYTVFRNVKDYGAAGDGITDDTAAIQRAISEGGRCAPGTCASTTTTPAIVYFPAGTYVVTSPIIDYYYTQMIGNPNCLPVIKASSSFNGPWVIDGDPYGANGLQFGATNVFWRQVRNFIVDMTEGPDNVVGVHWPTGQATSLTNMAFNMKTGDAITQAGVFLESGSGGFMSDLTFNGGLYGMNLGNQQFTMRNLTFNGCNTAINMFFDWGWTYTGLSINNCQVGLNLTSGGAGSDSIGSVTLFDSEINNTPIGILTAFTDPTDRFTNGSLILENVALSNVPAAVQEPNGVVLAGGTTTITAWGQGHAYTPAGGPNPLQGPISPNNRPAGLVEGDAFYQRSKPQYEDFSADQFISARDEGAVGDGSTDDTDALQGAIDTAVSQKKFLFIDAGDYVVTSTIYIPAGAVIVGEAYPVILASGAFFSDVNNPKPVIQIGKSGEQGTIEWTDTIVSTRGATAGAIIFEYNLASPPPGSCHHKKEKRQGWENWEGVASDEGSKSTTAANGVPTSGYHPTGSASNSWGQSAGPTGSGSWGSSNTNSASGTYTRSYNGTKTNSYTNTRSHTGRPTSTGSPKPPKEYKLCGPAGLWDVHARVGGFAGSNLQLADCPTTPQTFTPPTEIDTDCIASFLTMHITKSAANAYLENVWLWVADHDIEDQALRQITIYAGRGLLIESTEPIWLWGTAVEHHTLYEYQLIGASNIYMGQIQTETAYYQPNPPALLPFAVNEAYSDPNFAEYCFATSGFNYTSQTDFKNTCDGWGLRIVDSSDILVYGAGLYSFFANYNTSCSAVPSDPSGPYGCQTSIFSIEGNTHDLSVYNLQTVGAQSMIDIDGRSIASYVDNLGVFPDGIALFRTN